MAFKLTLDVLKQYVKVYLKAKKANEECKQLSERIKEYMTSHGLKTFGPPASQFMLEVHEAPRTDYGWKEECERMYRLHYGKKWREKLDEYKAECESTPVVTLEAPKANPQYRKAAA